MHTQKLCIDVLAWNYYYAFSTREYYALGYHVCMYMIVCIYIYIYTYVQNKCIYIYIHICIYTSILRALCT